MKASNDSGVGYSVYPFAIYSYASKGQVDVAKSIYEELKNEIQSDIVKGYGYSSRPEQIKWIQDNIRDVAWETADPNLKSLLESYVKEFDDLIKQARENKGNNS